jgi:hypothetical protein
VICSAYGLIIGRTGLASDRCQRSHRMVEARMVGRSFASRNDIPARGQLARKRH